MSLGIVYLQEKEVALKKQELKLKELIPQLELQQNTAINAETAQIYEGLKGIQTARERTFKIMKKGDEIWILGISKTPYEGMMTRYFREYHQRRYEKGIKCKYLYNEYAKEFAELSAKYPLSEVRYMPKGMITHSWMEIYADTVTIGINHKSRATVSAIPANPGIGICHIHPRRINDILRSRADPRTLIFLRGFHKPNRNLLDLVIRQRNATRHMRLDRLAML